LICEAPDRFNEITVQGFKQHLKFNAKNRGEDLTYSTNHKSRNSYAQIEINRRKRRYLRINRRKLKEKISTDFDLNTYKLDLDDCFLFTSIQG
jgi:hypothetical protein